MGIIENIGHVDAGQVQRAVLRDGDHQVTLVSFGAATQDWRADHRGDEIPVVLGYQDPMAYARNRYSMGAMVGRVANRIGGATFDIDGTSYVLPPNDCENLLHSGPTGLQTQMFLMESDTAQNAVRLWHRSPDGEGGFPAAIDIEIIVTLLDGQVTYDITATPDAVTPINIAQHNYYNLLGGGDIWDHRLAVASTSVTEKGDDLVPTGRIIPATGRMVLDGRRIGTMDQDRIGYDDNYVMPDAGNAVATLTADNGLSLDVWTDQPGLQVYTSGGLGQVTGGHRGQSYDRFGGVCLEAQNFPDAINHPHFPNVLYTPDRPYRQRTTIKIGG